MKRPRRLQKKKNKEKNEEKNEDFFNLTELGLGGEDPSEPMIDIQKVGGGDIVQIPVEEVKELYGTVKEYLRVNFGGGEYRVTIRKKGRATSERVKIATGPSKLQKASDFTAFLMEGQASDPMITMLQLQIEKARLQAERELKREDDRNAIFSNIAKLANPFFSAFARKLNESGTQEEPSVLKSATETIKDFAEVQSILHPKSSSGSGINLESLISGIATFLSALGQAQAGNQAFQPQPAQQQPQGVPQQQKQESLKTSAPSSPQANKENAPFSKGGLEGIANNLLGLEVIIESVVTMVEEKQMPKVVADYLLHNIKKITEEDKKNLSSQVGGEALLMFQNPALAWDVLCKIVPILREDGQYSNEIRFQLQKAVEGLPSSEAKGQ